MKFLRLILIPIALALFGGTLAAQGPDEDAIKARMLARVPQVDELKSAGVAGENNKGFLEQRGALSAERTQLMNAENNDRRALYGILASRLGLTIAVVGESRAEALRQNSAAGVWLQAPDGSWYRKAP